MNRPRFSAGFLFTVPASFPLAHFTIRLDSRHERMTPVDDAAYSQPRALLPALASLPGYFQTRKR